MNKIAVVVDMQHDFLRGGRLPVTHDDGIIGRVCRICEDSDLVIATRDWHPHDHSSFEKWPVHCVAGTYGADIVRPVSVLADVIFSKGQEKNTDGYSAAENDCFIPFLYSATGWGDEIIVCGVALDYCVKETALDIAAEFQGDVTVKIPFRATAAVHQDNMASMAITIADLMKGGVTIEYPSDIFPR